MKQNNFLYTSLLVQIINSTLYALEIYQDTRWFLGIFLIIMTTTVFFERIIINKKIHIIVNIILILGLISILSFNKWETNYIILSYYTIFMQLNLTFTRSKNSK